jgi:uncharacterized protein with NRDE domain
MCTIAILIDVVDGARFVLAANRDELYARDTRSPMILNADPRVVGGLDVVSNGTWLAVRADGQFAAVTNQRALATPPPGLRSRGLAVLELAAARDPDAYVASIDPLAYASMNLIWRSGDRVKLAYSRQDAARIDVITLPRGVHVLCNDVLESSDFPRGDRLRDAIAHSVDLGWPAIIEPLRRSLGDHARTSLAETPPSHLPRELARELTATCIHSELYGTRSSTLLAVAHDRVIDYLHADGPPCVTPYADLRSLLDA